MRWTDEVHVERTLQARTAAKRQIQGLDQSTQGRTALVHFAITTGVVSLLAKCEKRGKLKLFRIPIIGRWISTRAYYLRKYLSVPSTLADRKLQPSEAARQAALRREASANASTSQTQKQVQNQQHQRPSKKKKKGKR